MARAGRKRQPGARRRATTRAGRRPQDRGTAELRAHRMRLVGGAHQDDPRAADPLGILSLAGILSPAQVNAGWRFAVLRWHLFGKPMPDTRLYQRYLAGLVGPDSGQTTGDATELRMRRCYEAADRALRDAGALAWSETRAVCVEQRLPAWFWRARLGQPVVGDTACRCALVAGLSALDQQWRADAPSLPRRSRKI